jgi:hypothetical protein
MTDTTRRYIIAGAAAVGAAALSAATAAAAAKAADDTDRRMIKLEGITNADLDRAADAAEVSDLLARGEFTISAAEAKKLSEWEVGDWDLDAGRVDAKLVGLGEALAVHLGQDHDALFYPTFDAVTRADERVSARAMRDVLSDWVVDHALDYGREPPFVNLTRAAFKQLAHNNDVDWYQPLDYGVRATFQGIPIRVPGSKLNVSPDASPVAGRVPAPYSVAVLDVPAGAFVLEAHEDMAYHFIDHVTDESLDGREVDTVYMTRAAYKQAHRDNMVDFIPDENGHINIPVYLGRRISVVVDRQNLNPDA